MWLKLCKKGAVLGVKIFRLPVFFSDKKICSEALNPWAVLRTAPPTRGWEQIYYIARTYFTKNYWLMLDEVATRKRGLRGKWIVATFRYPTSIATPTAIANPTATKTPISFVAQASLRSAFANVSKFSLKFLLPPKAGRRQNKSHSLSQLIPPSAGFA